MHIFFFTCLWIRKCCTICICNSARYITVKKIYCWNILSMAGKELKDVYCLICACITHLSVFTYTVLCEHTKSMLLWPHLVMLLKRCVLMNPLLLHRVLSLSTITSRPATRRAFGLAAAHSGRAL